MIKRIQRLLSLLYLLLGQSIGFHGLYNPIRTRGYHLSAVGEQFEVEIDLPPADSSITAALKFDSILSVASEVVVVRYQIPFGLDVAPRKGLAVCTKDGPGGEKVGDVLRFTTQWALELPRGDGIATTVGSFAGGLSWQCSLFDVMKAKAWEQVVEALVSNTETRTDEVVLVFERPEGGVAPETTG